MIKKSSIPVIFNMPFFDLRKCLFCSKLIFLQNSTYFCKKSIDENEVIELFGKNIPIDMICKENQIDAHEVLVKLKVRKNYIKTTI